MADNINDLVDIAEEGSIVFPSWVNKVNAQFGTVSTLINELRVKLDEISTPFELSIASNTTVAYLGGTAMLLDRTVISIPAGIVEIQEGINYIYVNPAGGVSANLNLPETGYEIGVATMQNGRVVSVQNFPAARVREVLPNYVTIEELIPRTWQRVASASLSRDVAIADLGALTDNYHIVPFDTVVFGTGFNNAGIFTTAQEGEFVLHAQIRLYSPSTDALSGKISAFVSPSLGELGLALAQAESANGDLILNGENALPATITPRDIATIQAYLSEGSPDARIRAGSSATVWQVPIATEG